MNRAGCVKKLLKLTMIGGNVNKSEQRILYLSTIQNMIQPAPISAVDKCLQYYIHIMQWEYHGL